jgi:hypothetical protein
MRKGQDPGPDSRVGNPRDVEVTGDLPMSLTAFVGRERELDELQSLFRDGKRLVPWSVSAVSAKPAWLWSWASTPAT